MQLEELSLVDLHDSWSLRSGWPFRDVHRIREMLDPPRVDRGRVKGGNVERRSYVTIALLSFTIIALELVWTRILSAEFYYTFAFLVLSLAVLGLGLGGLATRLIPSLGSERALGPILTMTGLLGVICPILVFRLGLQFSQVPSSWTMAAKLTLAIVLLGSTFFTGGIATAGLFRRFHTKLPWLYRADLLCAGAGVIGAIATMNSFGTPQAAVLLTLPVFAASLLVSRSWARLAPLALAVGLASQAGSALTLLRAERQERALVIHEHWDAMGKVKVYGFDADYRGIEIDNVANSPVYGFDGNWDRPDSLRFEFGIDVSRLIERTSPCTFLSLGAGGGVDVLQALQAGAAEIHAVEINPYINQMMTDGFLSDFSGHIYSDPRVHVHTEDARAFVARNPGQFDVIYSLSSNTFAALASGSFALAESYLFTREAFRDYWRALSEDGFLMMEHQFYMPRLVSALIDALEAEGVEDVEQHFAVYDLPKMRRKMILLSKHPLTDDIRATAFGPLDPTAGNYAYLLHPPAADSLSQNLIERIVVEGWESVQPTAPVAVSPSSDGRPFVGQMGLWSNLSRKSLEKLMFLEVYGFPLAKLLVLTILAVVVVLGLPLTLLPYLVRRRPMDWALGGAAWLYFFLIGAAFMMVEVVLIQKYALFVGPSAYSVATILFALLVGSGIGARFSTKVKPTVAFLGVAGFLLVQVLAFAPIAHSAIGLPLAARAGVSALLVAPLGFFMGMPFPIGALRVREKIDWGFAVNGIGAVVGSTAILLVAMEAGLDAALLASAFVYLLACAMLGLRRGW